MKVSTAKKEFFGVFTTLAVIVVAVSAVAASLEVLTIRIVG